LQNEKSEEKKKKICRTQNRRERKKSNTPTTQQPTNNNQTSNNKDNNNKQQQATTTHCLWLIVVDDNVGKSAGNGNHDTINQSAINHRRSLSIIIEIEVSAAESRPHKPEASAATVTSQCSQNQTLNAYTVIVIEFVVRVPKRSMGSALKRNNRKQPQ
jgi:hypothetical protein